MHWPIYQYQTDWDRLVFQRFSINSLQNWTLTGGSHEKWVVTLGTLHPYKKSNFQAIIYNKKKKKAHFVYGRFSFFGTSSSFYTHQSLHVRPTLWVRGKRWIKCLVYSCCIQLEGKIHLLFTIYAILGYRSKPDKEKEKIGEVGIWQSGYKTTVRERVTSHGRIIINKWHVWFTVVPSSLQHCVFTLHH